MKRGAGAILAFALVAAPIAAHAKHAPASFAEPGDIIAAEGNFTHIGAIKGARVAIRATATADARIFAPRAVLATDYAKTASDAELARPWHTQQLWMSCDGSFAVTHGDWQSIAATTPPAVGWYVTIWHRQKGGAYKWVLNESGALRATPAESDMIAASIADCPARRGHGDPALATAPDARKIAPDYASYHADDGTMTWTTTTAQDGGLVFSLLLKQGGTMREVLHALTTPPAG